MTSLIYIACIYTVETCSCLIQVVMCIDVVNTFYCEPSFLKWSLLCDHCWSLLFLDDIRSWNSESIIPKTPPRILPTKPNTALFFDLPEDIKPNLSCTSSIFSFSTAIHLLQKASLSKRFSQVVFSILMRLSKWFNISSNYSNICIGLMLEE